MATASDTESQPVDGAAQTASADRVVDGSTSLLNDIDGETIVHEYHVGLHSDRIDFQEYAKIGVLLGFLDPKTLADLDQQTDVHDGVGPISQ